MIKTYISEDADYIFDGITGTLPLWWCAYIKLKERCKKMIQIDNKFDVGQEVHLVGRKCYINGKKKRFKWVVKSKKDKPLKVLCIFYMHKLDGEDELCYNIENHGKVKENRMFVDYESAQQQCDRWNEEGYGI